MSIVSKEIGAVYLTGPLEGVQEVRFARAVSNETEWKGNSRLVLVPEYLLLLFGAVADAVEHEHQERREDQAFVDGQGQLVVSVGAEETVGKERDDRIDRRHEQDSNDLSLSLREIITPRMLPDRYERDQSRYRGCCTANDPSQLVCVPMPREERVLIDARRIFGRTCPVLSPFNARVITLRLQYEPVCQNHSIHMQRTASARRSIKPKQKRGGAGTRCPTSLRGLQSLQSMGRGKRRPANLVCVARIINQELLREMVSE